MSKVKKQYRCPHCGKLFFKGDLVKGFVEVKCKNCKNICSFDGGQSASYIVLETEE
ncbi:hypothetical protein ACFL08_00785 [Patescibacteria group bacterium]